MIALLRRLRRSAGEIRAAEWMLLGIETVAVVIGIIIAFQLQEWATDRREKKDVDRLLERLLDETRTSLTHHNYYARQASSALTEAKPIAFAFSQALCPASLGDVEAVDARITDRPSDAALTELISVVGLSAIPSDELKESLSSYNYANNALHTAIDDMRARQVPVLVADDQRRIRSVDPAVAARDHNAPPPNLANNSDLISVTYDRDALCADPQFRERYIASTNDLLAINAMRFSMAAITLRLCKMLASELGQECVTPMVRASFPDGRLKLLERNNRRRDEARRRMMEDMRDQGETPR